MIAAALRIDACRPASWIALAGALAVVPLLPPGGSPALAAACGVLLAVAAIGDLVAAAPRDEFPATRVVCRGAWPLAGSSLGWLAGAASANAVLGGEAAVLLVCLAAVAVGRGWPVRSPFRSALLVHGGGSADPWPDRLVMPSMLAAMAVCYFLAPELAGWYAAVAASWFVLLAVPRATLWGGDAAARWRLLLSAPGRPRPPGTAARAAWGLAASVCLLGWPAVVALALQRDPSSASGPPLALGMLGALAAVATATAVVTERCRLPADTPLAATAATLAVLASRTAQIP